MEPVILTEAALQHVKKMIAKRGSGTGLRIGIKTTGCSGFSYVMEIADNARPGDKCCPQTDGTSVFIDAKSYPFIEGVRVDYMKKGLNEEFQFTNPNAQGICGCGESFSVAVDQLKTEIIT